MSIQSELARLTNAKAAIQAAIEGKGVTVPDGTLLDGMASLIEGIEAGVSISYGRLKSVTNGTFTVAERTEISSDVPYVLQHNAGVIPFMITIEANTTKSSGDLNYIVCFRRSGLNDSTKGYSYSTRRNTANYIFYASYGGETGFTMSNSWNTETAKIFQYNTTMYFNAGITYKWVAYYVE